MTLTPATPALGSLSQERVIFERIGKQEWQLSEVRLDVHNDVALWSDNPRLQTLALGSISSEEELEEALRRTPGYDDLRRSIQDIGQMHSVYVQKLATGKYLVLEGATRVTILRELDRKYQSGAKQGIYRTVMAKVLPLNFGDKEVAVLLAGIHVRGSGVREWGRYIEAKFIYETVVGRPGQGPLMNQAALAESMGKSESWVARLKSAYEFALKFVEHVDDDPNPRKLAAEKFSTLEEISKARVIGSQLRDFENKNFDDLREDVFEMVRNDVFQEYRDARLLKEFHEDPDLWAQLKSGEKHIAHKLAQQAQDKGSHPKARISALPQLVRRALERGEDAFDDDDIASLQQTIDLLEDRVHSGINPYRVALKKVIRTLNKASRADVADIPTSEVRDLHEALEYFNSLVARHSHAGGV